MLRTILACVLIGLIPGMAGAACGPIPSDYPVLSGDKLEVGKESTVNNGATTSGVNGGRKYEGNLDAINASSGAVVSASPSYPSLEPATFPSTGSTDTNAATVAAGSYDDITVAQSTTTTFTGGTYYIDKLVVGKSATVNLAAGRYFIDQLSLGDDARIVVSSGPVQLYIGSEVSGDDDLSFNAAGAVADFQVFLYPGADWQVDKDVTFVGVIYAPGTSSDIEFDDDSSIRGALVTAGEVKLGQDTSLTFSAADQAAVGGVSTCVAAAAAPSGFNAFETGTAAGSVSGVIRTKVAASAFNLDVVALKTGGTAVETAFAGGVKLELVDASSAASCSSYPWIQVLDTLTFTATDQGRKTLTGISEAKAWPNARIRMSYPATGTPTVTACSTDNFAIRPASLSVAVSDTDWQNAGTSRTLANMNASDGFVHKAGQPFTLRATARDASSNITSNYAGQPTLKTLACMLPTPTCTNGILTPGVWSGSGTVASTSATYSEAGSFNLTLEDQTFANVDNADSTLLERTIPQAAALAVGRFVPDHFELTPGIVPSFKTFNETPANCPVRSFTYIGQPFGYGVKPTATILAKGQGNNTLANYKGSLWKIGGAIAPVVVKDCSTDLNTCVFTSNWSAAGASSEVIETYTYVLVPASTPNWDDTGSIPAAANVNTSTGLISFSASDTLAFKRSNTAPQAPFTAGITNIITVKDLSEAGNCGVANCDITTATPAQFANIGFDVTPGNEFRFGQLVLSNAHGSELLGLPVPIETRYWNVTGFALNAADSCTQLSAADVALSNWQRYLNNLETSVTLSGRFSAGRGNLRLSAPGEGNTGSVDLTVQLDAAAQTWLQGHWSGTPVQYNQNPAARASFGLYRSSESLIYMREMY